MPISMNAQSANPFGMGMAQVALKAAMPKSPMGSMGGIPMQTAMAPPLGQNAAAPIAAQAQDPKALIFTLLAQLRDQLIAQIQGSGSTPPTGAPVSTAGVNTAPAPAPLAAPVNQNSLANLVKGTPGERQQLLANLNAIAQDPEGRVLVEQAIQRGVTFDAGGTGQGVLGFFRSPDSRPGADGTPPNHIRLADANDKLTMIHELWHASTPEDGNDKHEEGTANILANEIGARIGAVRARDKQTIFNETLPLYQDLADGSAAKTLRALSGLGITTFVA